MVKIQLDTYTERLLLKKVQGLIKFVPYDIYICIELIINEALSQHFIYLCKLEEIFNMLQESETELAVEDKGKSKRKELFENSCQPKTNHDNKIVFYNQTSDYEVVEFKRVIMMMLTGKSDVVGKNKTNGIIL